MPTTIARPKKGVRTKAARTDKAGRSAKKATGKKQYPGFDRFKTYNGQVYTGVQVGRGHHWHYDQGDWKETKITPDLWEVSYAVTKRRVGKAPDYSGAPVGTEYHWYIVAHQTAKKLNANDYETKMTGLKFKLAHKRAETNKWSATAATQRKHLAAYLRQFLDQLEKDGLPLEFEYNGNDYTGEAIPIPWTCNKHTCLEYDIMLNNEPMGIIRHMKSGWKMDLVKDQKLVDSIGEQLTQNYSSK